MWWSGWPLAPACLRQKAVVVAFARGFPAVAIGPSQQNLLAVLLRAELWIVCSLCKLKDANDRGNSGVELFVWWVVTAVHQTPLIHTLVWHCEKERKIQGSDSAGCYVCLTFLMMFSGTGWLLKP